MPPEPKRPIPVSGHDEEETSRLHAAFKGLYAKFYPHWEAEIVEYLKDHPPSRADWAFVEIAELALTIQDGPMNRLTRLMLRGKILLELAKSFVPITKPEMEAYVADHADQMTGSFIGLWLQVLQGAGMLWDGTLHLSRLDDAMLPTGLEPGVLETMLDIGEVPFERLREILSAVRRDLSTDAALPPEVEIFMTASHIRLAGTPRTVN